MNALVTVGVLVGTLVVALLVGPYLAQTMVKGSSHRGGGIFGVLDELYHPAQHNAMVNLQEQHSQRADAANGDGDDDPDDDEDAQHT